MDSKFVDDYDRESVQRKILNSYCIEAREEGYNDGIEQRNIEIAKKMLGENIDIIIISKVTSLSIEEINQLRQD